MGATSAVEEVLATNVVTIELDISNLRILLFPRSAMYKTSSFAESNNPAGSENCADVPNPFTCPSAPRKLPATKDTARVERTNLRIRLPSLSEM